MNIPQALYDQMLAHVRDCYPEEACGILGGLGGEAVLVLAVENELHSRVRFRMNPREQLGALLALEQADLELLGIWHSHPTGPADLSPTDLAQANYPEAALLVWSPHRVHPNEWVLHSFRITGEQVEEDLVHLV